MEKILYRNDSCYGSGVRDVFDVIWHECTELGNTDILSCCLHRYHLSKDLNEKLKHDILWLEGEFVETGEYPETLKEDIQQLIEEISAISGKEIRYALWLATEKTVRELYYGDDGNILAYETSDVVLSFLEEDGALFGYPKLPKPIVS